MPDRPPRPALALWAALAAFTWVSVFWLAVQVLVQAGALMEAVGKGS